MTNPEISLSQTACAYCETFGNATEIYPANFDAQDFNPAVFSARRIPDRLHYRMVRCRTCGLLRSDPVADSQSLQQLYAQSDQTYGPELRNIRATYARYLRYLDRFGAQKGSLLEIGCGSGFFLEEAELHGYTDARGIEPSQSAAAIAVVGLRNKIVNDVLRPGIFGEATFDIICMFQVFDHLPDPNASLRECYRLLKPGGLILALNHDAGSFSARLLGERSPIVDIEHTYLYDRRTMQAIFRKHGFQIRRVGLAWNRYSLQYLLHLVPLPGATKAVLQKLMLASGVGRARLTVALGNLYVIATKPIPQ